MANSRFLKCKRLTNNGVLVDLGGFRSLKTISGDGVGITEITFNLLKIWAREERI